jgi:tight adherence protein B
VTAGLAAVLAALAVVVSRPRWPGTSVRQPPAKVTALRAALVPGAGIDHPWRRRRRAEADATAVLEVCETLAGELLAGRPPGEALAVAGERWRPWTEIVEAHQLGGDVPVALRTLAARRPGAADLRLVAAAWQVAHHSGNGLARALDRTARGIRARRRTRRLVESELASSRATARLVACLPLLVLLAGSGVGGSPWAFLLTTPVGLGCLVVGSALIVAGLWWIEAIADRAAPPC